MLINNISNHYILKFVVCFIYLVVPAYATDIPNYLTQNCSSCHALSKPDFMAEGIQERINRRGPHLFYAGNKFREKWLLNWLKKPYQIRPGGSYPPLHTIVTDEGDVIDKQTLINHVALPDNLAQEVSSYLMSLHPMDALEKQVDYQAKTVSSAMGKMNFNKFKGCGACHLDSTEEGGLSGPELYTAWQRLKPNFVGSYIKNPVSWDPYSMMPSKHLKDSEINKLIGYLKTLKE